MEQQFGEFQAAMDKETKEFDLMGDQRGGAAGEYGKLCPVWERESTTPILALFLYWVESNAKKRPVYWSKLSL